jgi:hypothetical protein
VECGETYQILGVPAEEVDGLRDVAIHAADQQVVLLGVDAGDEGQEGGEEEETHGNFLAVLFAISRCTHSTWAAGLERGRLDKRRSCLWFSTVRQQLANRQ